MRISTTPTARLVISMLDDVISILNEKEHLLIHTNRDYHYQWPGCISQLDNFSLKDPFQRKAILRIFQLAKDFLNA